MANIKVGDVVAQVAGFNDHLRVKKVISINPHTIAVAAIYKSQDGTEIVRELESRQPLETWRIVVPETVAEIERLFKESERLRKEARELYRSMPKIEL